MSSSELQTSLSETYTLLTLLKTSKTFHIVVYIY